MTRFAKEYSRIGGSRAKRRCDHGTLEDKSVALRENDCVVDCSLSDPIASLCIEDGVEFATLCCVNVVEETSGQSQDTGNLER